MTILSVLYRLNQKIKYHTSSDYFSKRVAEINSHEQIVINKKSSFRVIGCQLNFSPIDQLFVIEGIDLFRKLLKQTNLIFSLQGGVLTCTIDKLQILITTAEELFILSEIWVEGCYKVNVSTSKPLVVIDVGMNVCYASLFFASLDNVKKVYAYEPFKRTFEQGLTNLKLNSDLSTKINVKNIGLSSKDFQLIVDYSPKHRGRTGVWGTELVTEKVDNVYKEELYLRSFNDEIKKIINTHPNCDFIWKIDCEGSEYDIFEVLDVSLLKDVRAILMEWHSRGPFPLSRILRDNGFTSLSFNSNSNKVGMIYAFK